MIEFILVNLILMLLILIRVVTEATLRELLRLMLREELQAPQPRVARTAPH